MSKEKTFLLTAMALLVLAAGMALSPCILAAERGPANAYTLAARQLDRHDIRGIAEIMSGNAPAVLRTAYAEEFASETARGQTTFTVALEDCSGSFDAEFVPVSEGGRQSVMPKEWEVTRFSFLVDQRNDVFLACTDAGIWRIDPEAREAVKLSADAFQGRTRTQIKEELGTGRPLFWTDSPILSPNGQYLAYLSNRADPLSDGDAVWVLDTRTGEEHLLMPQKGTWKALYGFISDKDIFVEALDNHTGAHCYAVADAISGKSSLVNIPATEGMLVQSVSANGSAAILSYDGEERLILLRIGTGGSVLDSVSFPGHYPAGVKFSPGGATLAAAVSDAPELPADDLLLIDVRTGTGGRLGKSASCGKPGESGPAREITNYAWANNVSLLVTRRTESGETTWLYNSAAGRE